MTMRSGSTPLLDQFTDPAESIWPVRHGLFDGILAAPPKALGVGADDVFVLVHAWGHSRRQRAPPSQSIPKGHFWDTPLARAGSPGTFGQGGVLNGVGGARCRGARRAGPGRSASSNIWHNE